MALIRTLVKEGLTGLYYVKKMVLIPEKAVLLTPLKTKWPLWPYYGQIWPNMCLITIFGENNFTSQFLCKKGGIPEKAVLLTHLRQNGNFWPY